MNTIAINCPIIALNVHLIIAIGDYYFVTLEGGSFNNSNDRKDGPDLINSNGFERYKFGYNKLIKIRPNGDVIMNGNAQ